MLIEQRLDLFRKLGILDPELLEMGGALIGGQVDRVVEVVFDDLKTSGRQWSIGRHPGGTSGRGTGRRRADGFKLG